MSGSGWDLELLYGHEQQVKDHDLLCGIPDAWDEYIQDREFEIEAFDHTHERASVFLPSDTPYGSVALTIVPFSDAHRRAA